MNCLYKRGSRDKSSLVSIVGAPTYLTYDSTDNLIFKLNSQLEKVVDNIVDFLGALVALCNNLPKVIYT